MADPIEQFQVMIHQQQEAMRDRTRLARERGLDYDTVIERSGEQRDVSTNPVSGQPRFPFLHAWIFTCADPAAAAYEYGIGRLSN